MYIFLILKHCLGRKKNTSWIGKSNWMMIQTPLRTDNEAHVPIFSGHPESWLYFLARS